MRISETDLEEGQDRMEGYSYIKSEKVERGMLPEEKAERLLEEKKERLAQDDFQHFCDMIAAKRGNSKCVFTIDYFDTSIGILQSKETPSSLSFSIALLHEILSNLKPSDQLCDKIKYATFLLNLATRNIEFSLLYDLYHQIEIEATTKDLSWSDREIRSSFEEKYVEKFIVKEDICNLSDINESDNKYDPLNNPMDDLDDNYDDLGDDLGDNPDYDVDDENIEKLFEKFAQDDTDIINGGEDFNGKENNKSKIKRKYTKRKKEDGVKEGVRKRKRRKLDNELKEGDAEWVQGDLNAKLDSGWSIPISKVTGKKLKRILRPGVLPCPSCDYKAKDNHDFDKHTFMEHEASRLCTQCGYLSSSFRDYTSHNQTHIFTCDICQEKKLGLKGFRKHMKSHEAPENIPVPLSTFKKEYNRVPCDMCGVLLFENNLKQHILTEHTHETHKCDLCDYTANTKLKVQNHRRSHFVKMSKCHECGKNVKDIRKHFLRNCAGKEKQRHYCHLCEKSFSLKEGLDRHIKHIHQKILNYHCEHCDYKTYAGFNLRLHISKMHTKEEMEKICHFCNQKTNSLEYHIRIYHIEEQLKSQANKEESKPFDANQINKQEALSLESN